MASKKSIIISLLITFTLTTFAYAQVKKADLAGTWYPAGRLQLLAQLEEYLDKAEPPQVDGKIIALISPHAGYTYSGPIAAYGYKAVEGMEIDTVIVIGFSHRRYYDGIAVLDADAYQTPLGKIKINKDLTKRLIGRSDKIYASADAFNGENSVELQIPLIQTALKDFDIVLIAIGEQSLNNSRIIAGALAKELKGREKFLLVASTDMCHYLPYGEANKLDGNTVAIIEEFNPKKLYTESLLKDHRLMCGYGAVTATMLAAKSLGAGEVKVLKYANSGDTAGNREEVVGYLSAAIYRGQRPKGVPSEVEGGPGARVQDKERGEKPMLTKKQKDRLLGIARKTMETYIKKGKKLDYTEKDPLLNREMGAFVTLHRNGQLRGCIGNIIGSGPLYLTVRDMAIQSSTQDPRFSPVGPDELEKIDIEISVLSELEEIKDPNVIEVGKHGVLVRSGSRSGVYLPQVGTETGWNREEFMMSLCGNKAGLPPDAWKTGKCKIFIFTAEVFGEK